MDYNYVILVSGVIAGVAAVYPVPYVLYTLWNTRTHLIRMFYFALWIGLILMAFHHIVYFYAFVSGFKLSPNFDAFWIFANFFFCLLWIPLYIEVRARKNYKKLKT